MARRIEVVHTRDRDPSVYLPYAPAMKVTGGSTVYMAGVTAAGIYHNHPHRPEDFESVPDGIAGQARIALENIRQVLDACGATFSDVVQMTRYLTDINLQDELNEMCTEYFGDHRPCTDTIEVTRLAGHPKLKVELSAVAAVD